jgi:hypothetical protein
MSLSEFLPNAGVRLWHIASVIAVQRHVRSRVQTGSERHAANVTRLPHSGHWVAASRVYCLPFFSLAARRKC